MALFDQKLIDEIRSRVILHHRALSAALGLASEHQLAKTDESSAPLTQDLQLLIAIANGERSRSGASKADVQRVETALLAVQAILFSNVLQTRATIPDAFWQSSIGVLCSRVRWWISADDLITISNAAALAFGENTQPTRMKIVRAIERGQLDWIPNPSIANPQQNKCVFKSQVERLREEQSRPE